MSKLHYFAPNLVLQFTDFYIRKDSKQPELSRNRCKVADDNVFTGLDDGGELNCTFLNIDTLLIKVKMRSKCNTLQGCSSQ